MATTTLLVLAFAAVTQSYGLPPGLLSAVCFHESSHQLKALHPDDGQEDSVGICQIHLSTARQFGYLGDQRGLFDRELNILYAAKYLRHQLDRYRGDVTKAVAAYNSGTFRVNKTGEIKNKHYVQAVMLTWAEGR